ASARTDSPAVRALSPVRRAPRTGAEPRLPRPARRTRHATGHAHAAIYARFGRKPAVLDLAAIHDGDEIDRPALRGGRAAGCCRRAASRGGPAVAQPAWP